MKHLSISICLFLLIINLSYSSEFKIISFNENALDLTARRNAIKDNFGNYCGLLKVITDLDKINIESVNEVVFNKKYISEFHYYLSPNTNKIFIKKDGFQTLQYSLPDLIQSNIVYILKLTSENKLKKYDLTFELDKDSIFISKNDSPPIFCESIRTIYRLTEGKYIFKFMKKGFKDEIREINFKKDQSIKVHLTKGKSSTNSNNATDFLIKSEPNEALVILNEQVLGLTPINTKLIPDKKYENLTIIKNGFQTIYRNQYIPDKTTTTLNFNLKTFFCKVNINSIPSSSDIFIDNEYLGKTPLYDYKVNQDSISVLIRKEKYHSELRKISTKNQDNLDINIKLKPNFGDLYITSKPDGADVFINDKKVGIAPYRDSMLVSQLYNVTISKDLWGETEDKIEITDLCKFSKKYDLQPGPKLAEIKFESGIMDSLKIAKLFLNNNKIEHTNFKDLFLESGMYKLEISHPDFFDKTYSLSLKESEKLSLNLDLVNIKNKKFYWSLNKWISLGTFATSLGISVFYNEKGNDYYSNYLSATTTDLAGENYDNTLKYDTYRNISAGVSLIPLYWFIHSWYEESKCKK